MSDSLLSLGQSTPVTFTQVLKFIGYIVQLKDLILLAQPAHYLESQSRPVLPPTIHTFLGYACGIPGDQIDRFWIALGQTAWSTDIQFSPTRSRSFMAAFTTFGHELGISKCSGTSIQ